MVCEPPPSTHAGFGLGFVRGLDGFCAGFELDSLVLVGTDPPSAAAAASIPLCISTRMVATILMDACREKKRVFVFGRVDARRQASLNLH